MKGKMAIAAIWIFTQTVITQPPIDGY